jgi:hypothetical protein
MADQLQLRGGSTAQTAAFTGALREVTVDTDKKTVVVHDGTTAGGNPLLRQDLSNLPAGTIDNADINASAGIVDTKLATIATAGKVSNSATTATSANTNSAIVARDASGNFTAGTITGALTGAASSNVLKAGDTMTGNLTVPSLNGGPLAGTRNRIINGDMRIDQRNNGAVVTLGVADAYTVDRWNAQEDTDGGMTAERSTTAPAGFIYSLLFTTTTADTSLGATQSAWLRQHVEGLNVDDLAWGTANAKTITLSFWVRSSLTGTFGGSATNSAVNRSYPFTFTISSANTFEYKTITIPGDTTGTWLADAGRGITIFLGLGVGSTYSGTAATWAGAAYYSATGATSVVGTNGATFYITGVQLEPGTVATPFERRIYGQELALCQRYFQWFGAGTSGQEEATTTFSIAGIFSQPMRAAPSATYIGTIYTQRIPGLDRTITGVSIASGALTDQAAWVLLNTSGGNVAGRFFQNRDASSNIQLSAEL